MLEGQISHLERHDERPPTDCYRVVSRILIGLLLFVPYCVLFAVSGIISFVFAFLGFSSLTQLFNPIIWTTSIFELLEVIALGRIRKTDTVPVYRGMIEDSSGSEYAFIMRGSLNSGNLVVGHHVRLSGKRQRGTLIVRTGTDLTANGMILSSYHNPWKIVLVIVLCLYAVLALGIYVYL